VTGGYFFGVGAGEWLAMCAFAVPFLVWLGWLGLWWRRRRKSRAREGLSLDLVEVITQPPARMAQLVHLASDAELCSLWERSGTEIRHVHSPTTLAWYVTLRRSLLVELERRDPRVVDSWLAAGPDSRDLPAYLHRR
jgi:hypothetical protein